MVLFRVFYIIQAFPAFEKREDTLRKSCKKEEKTLKKKKSEEQEENIPYIYKCYLHF